MRLRCELREEVRVDDFSMQRLSTLGVGTGVGGCTYAQGGAGVERVGEDGRGWRR
jgi:hypothetical protein